MNIQLLEKTIFIDSLIDKIKFVLELKLKEEVFEVNLNIESYLEEIKDKLLEYKSKAGIIKSKEYQKIKRFVKDYEEKYKIYKIINSAKTILNTINISSPAARQYILGLIELIAKEKFYYHYNNFMWLIELIAKKNKTDNKNVERVIRYSISKIKNTEKFKQVFLNNYKTKDFIFTLYELSK